MLDANKVITLISKVLNLKTRQYDIKKTELVGSWFEQTKTRKSEEGTHTSKTVHCRFPLENENDIVINEGDLLFLGSHDIQGLTRGEIKKQFNAVEVMNITYNINSLRYSRHVHVVAE